MKNVFKSVNVGKLERFLNLYSTTDIKAGLDKVNALWAEYQEALPLGQGLEKTELQYGDEFVLLAGHLLLDLYQQHHQVSLMIQAISLLETALNKSIHNFQIKLLLVRMYTMMGK